MQEQNQVIILIFLHMIYALIVLSIELFRIVKLKDITLVSYVNLMFAFVYGVIPSIIHIGYVNGEYSNEFLRYSDNGITYFYAFYAMSIIAYFFLQLGYHLKLNAKQKTRVINLSILRLSAHVLLIISLISTYLWTKSYDTIFDIIKYADFIRAGFVPVYNPFAFMKYFVSLFMFSSYIYFILMQNGKSLWLKLTAFLGFIISFGGSIFYILANDGRMLAVIYLAVFILIKVKIDTTYKGISHKKIILSYLFIGILSLIAISLVEPVLYYAKYQIWRFNSSINPFRIVRDEFNYLLISAQTSIFVRENNLLPYRFFEDIISGLLAWVPSRFTLGLFTTTFEINTSFVHGVSGQVPTDLVSMSIYSLGYLGVIIYPLIFGVIIKYFQNLFSHGTQSIYYNMLYVLVGFYMLKSVSHSDLNNIMLNIFFFVFGHLIIVLAQKIKFGEF